MGWRSRVCILNTHTGNFDTVDLWRDFPGGSEVKVNTLKNRTMDIHIRVSR